MMENFAGRAVLLLVLVLVRIAMLVLVHCDDLAADTRALVEFSKGVGGRTKTWTGNGSTCDWEGITCNSTPRVVSLSLSAANLAGIIPPATLGNLTALLKLKLRSNSLRGSIPADLSNCKDLRTLYLQGNRFAGPLPTDFSVWPNLVRLNLAFNNFSGPLPTSLNNLKRLGTLFLENNSLAGPLPPLDLPNLVYFNVSNNNFTGSVPDSYNKFSSDSFLGNNNLCYPCNNNKPRTYKREMIIGIVVGVALVLLLILFSRRLDKREKKPKPENQRTEETDSSFTKEEYSISVQGPEKMHNKLLFLPGNDHPFSFEELLNASAKLLARGSTGSVYKVVLETGSVLAVKRLCQDVSIRPAHFANQINALGKMRHRNLLALKAYHYSMAEKLLLYNYMPLGSLESLLHGNNRATGVGLDLTPLDWDTRVHIALGAAMGIEYLHKQGSKISHGNIKSSNILVTEKYDACVSDFGLAQMVSARRGNASPSSSDAGQKRTGTRYRAPEVSDGGKFSQQADVYSFGVLLLEMITGKAPNEGVDLPGWVQSVVREEWTADVFDTELVRMAMAESDQGVNEEEMLQLLQVGMACVVHHPNHRPTMSQVVKMIQGISHTDTVDDAFTTQSNSQGEPPNPDFI